MIIKNGYQFKVNRYEFGNINTECYVAIEVGYNNQLFIIGFSSRSNHDAITYTSYSVGKIPD